MVLVSCVFVRCSEDQQQQSTPVFVRHAPDVWSGPYFKNKMGSLSRNLPKGKSDSWLTSEPSFAAWSNSSAALHELQQPLGSVKTCVLLSFYTGAPLAGDTNKLARNAGKSTRL